MSGSNHKSYSPMQLAMRRLLQHHLAMAGFVLVCLMVLLVVVGGFFVDTTPEEVRLWVKKLPPGASHPHCRSEMIFEIGKRPALENSLLRSEELIFTTQMERQREVRVVLRRKKIFSIAIGAEQMRVLDLAKLAADPLEILEDGSFGRTVPRVVLNVGDKPPDGVFEGKARVLIIALKEASEPVTQTIVLKDGNVISINKNYTEAALTIRGEHVLDVKADGISRTLSHPLGTDEMGRDVFLRIVSGGRVSLMVGLVATLVSLIIGVVYGAIAGYVGGRTDALMMRFVDIMYGLPFIFLVLLLMVAFDRNVILLFVALGMVQWLTMARIVRGHILSLREKEFIDAARMSGAPSWKIVLFHLIPHTVGPVIVYSTLTVPVVILEESFLAFIGLPVQYQNSTLDSWGSLVHQGMNSLGDAGENWWLLVFPAMAMVITLFGLNCFGDGLRDSFDPKSS